MNLLIIGGTRFVGRHLVEEALKRGHNVTLFHRGQSNPGLFAVEEIFGDRDGDIAKLEGRKWDAVIDTCGYVPRVVRQSTEILKSAVGSYCFISSISAYDVDESEPAVIDETTKLARFDEPPQSEEITPESYGPFKVQCEEAVVHDFGTERSLLIRPGLIVGPHDTTDRFTYWIDRFSRSDPVLMPERREQGIQFVDVRDLVQFTLSLLAADVAGPFNVTGPATSLTMGAVWDSCYEICNGHPERIVVTDKFLVDHDVREWRDLPFVRPQGPDLFHSDIRKALACGLELRSISDTIRDTAAWHRGRGDVPLKSGLTREREKELLDLWSKGERSM